MPVRSLRLVAPFRSQFNIDSAKMIEEGEFFNAFLQTLENDFRAARDRLLPDVPKDLAITVNTRPDDTSGESQYISLDQTSSLFNSPKYLSVSFTDQARILPLLQGAAVEADKACQSVLSNKLSAIPETLNIDIFDNTIAILTLDLSMDDQFGGDDWGILDQWTTRIGYFFLKLVYQTYIFPLLRAINQYADHKGELRIRNPQRYFLFYDLSTQKADAARVRLLWVNRTLVCPKGQALDSWATRHMDAATALRVNGADAHLSWGNNVIETVNDDRPAAFPLIWEGMYLAQYYYAVLDVAGKNLKRFISATYDKKSSRELRALSSAMDDVINAVAILQVEYKDLSVELQGMPKTVFRRLEKEWDFAALLEVVQGKSDLCKAHGQLLNAYINQRNSIRVEMVLTGVAGVGLIGLMMNLSSYGRALMREGYKNDVIGLLDIGQHLSPSMMIWIGIFLAIAISAFVSINRTR